MKQYSAHKRKNTGVPYLKKPSIERFGTWMTNKIKAKLQAEEGIDLFQEPTLVPISVDRVEMSTSWVPTKENLDKIHQLAMAGCSEQTIASVAMGVTDETYFDLRDTFPEILETIKAARRLAEAHIAIELFNEMCKHDQKKRVDIMRFYLQNRHRWEQTLNVNLPNVAHPKRELNDLSGEELKRLIRNRTLDIVSEIKINPVKDLPDAS